jgi:hypothetical protein
MMVDDYTIPWSGCVGHEWHEVGSRRVKALITSPTFIAMKDVIDASIFVPRQWLVFLWRPSRRSRTLELAMETFGGSSQRYFRSDLGILHAVSVLSASSK